MNLENCVVYDVEVVLPPEDVPGGWDNPEGMGFASAVAYEYRTDRYHFFLHEQGKLELIKLLDDRIAVTFNGVKFDSRVVLGNDRNVSALTEYTVFPTIAAHKAHAVKWHDCDLLLLYVQARFGYETVLEAETALGNKKIHDGTFGLDGLVEGTLGLRKIGHGAKAPILYQNLNYDYLLEYNLHDVRLTKKLFDFLRRYGFLLVDRAGRTVRINI